MKILQIIPPELFPFDRRRYYADVEYRELIDRENEGERYERLKLLFNLL